MTSEQRAKAVDKIRKVLALASDLSITEAEQTNYRRRARILMEQYAIAHLEDPDVTEKVVIEIPFKPYNGLVISRGLFNVLPHILNPIAIYFDCFVIANVRDGVRYETFAGFRPNIEMVQYAANVVLRQGMDEFKRLYRLNRSITLGDSFWTGFAHGIQIKFKLTTDQSSSEKGLVLYDQVKKYVNDVTGGKRMSANVTYRESDFVALGQEAGENVVVHTALAAGEGKGNLLK